MSKKSHGWWSDSKSEDEEIHHIVYPWDEDDFGDDIDPDEPDERSGADDYVSSRPWGVDNDG